MKTSILITGGAGFIGSHLVDALMEKGLNCKVLDNLSSSKISNVKKWMKNPRFKFIRGDLTNLKLLSKILDDCEVVFHLAANPEVRVSSTNPEVHFQQNVLATFNLLEAIRKSGNIKELVFTSSSTVYGDAEVIPTPETQSPNPISVYGASKLACEALIASYARTYDFKAIIYRLANIIGSRSKHGVIYDFIVKLRRNPNELEILGDGTQRKSYLYISDCINAMLIGYLKSKRRVEVFNVGSEDWITVKDIAEIVCEEMNLKGTEFRFTGGVEGRGWKGDVKNMLLDIKKVKSLGWRPEYNSSEAVRLATKDLLREI